MRFHTSVIGVALLAVSAFGQVPQYSLQKEVKLGGDTGWDYLSLDPSGRHLFISRGSHMMVVDTRSLAVVGDIPGTNGVHGAAIVAKHGVGFTSNGRDNSVTEFSLKDYKPIQNISVGKNPDAILYEPSTDRIFTFNGGSNDATAIDASSGKVLGTVALDGRPEFPAADGSGKLFCNIEDKSEIQQIDPQALNTTNTWSIAPGEEPSGLAIDPKDGLLFSVCSNQKMVVFDYNAGKVVATPTIGNGPDAAGFDPKNGLAFSSNGQDGTISVVGRDSSGNWNTLQTVATRKSARTMTLDPKSHKIYLVSAEFMAPTQPPAAGERRRRQMVPGSFTLLVVGPSR